HQLVYRLVWNAVDSRRSGRMRATAGDVADEEIALAVERQSVRLVEDIEFRGDLRSAPEGNAAENLACVRIKGERLLADLVGIFDEDRASPLGDRPPTCSEKRSSHRQPSRRRSQYVDGKCAIEPADKMAILDVDFALGRNPRATHKGLALEIHETGGALIGR